jgi:polyhydroxybutyrate depolymerase
MSHPHRDHGRRRWPALALASALLAASASEASANETIIVDGVRRTYAIEAPAGGAGARPVVFFLHGAGGSADAIARDGWSAEARREGFLLVGLQGLPVDPARPSDLRGNPNIWNDGSGRGRRTAADEADVRYFDAVLAAVEKTYPVDRSRIYVAGHSNGASMSFRLAEERGDEIAAIAVLAGGVQMAAPPRRPVPALIMLGEQDPIVPLNGGRTTLPWGGRTYDNPPFIQTAETWARRNGCDADARPTETDAAQTRTLQWAPCQVTFVILRNHGHQWPNGPQSGFTPPFIRRATGPYNAGLDATEMAWRFLKDKRLAD